MELFPGMYTVEVPNGDRLTNLAWLEALSHVEAYFRVLGDDAEITIRRQ